MISSPLTLKKEALDFNKTGILPPLIRDYIRKEPLLDSLYNYPSSFDSFEEAVTNRNKFPFYRNELTDALLKQNHLVINEYNYVHENILSFHNSNTYSVTTGHQLCIFTGPLYFIYKILSTVNLAESLNKKYPAFHFVPVYWMASEDHDFEEINHIFLYNKKLQWNYAASGAAGNLPVDSMAEILSALKEIMGESITSSELFKIFEEAYMFNNTLADATRFLVNKLFGKYGLVIIDGDDASLKKIFSPIIVEELVKQPSQALVNETSQYLSSHGYKPQVNPRPVNLFFLEDELRERVVISPEGKYEVLNTDLSFTAEMITDLAARNPEHFSPNVILRPLYEEYILPNLAYIGGPGELSYWLQYKKLFEYFNVHFPVLILRSSVLMIDSNSAGKMQQFDLKTEDLFIEMEDLLKKVFRKSDDQFILTEEEKELKSIFEKINRKAVLIDKTLDASVQAELQKMLNSLEVIAKKAAAAIKRKNETTVSQLKTLKEKVYPEGVFQERHLNFIPFYLKYGNTFIDLIKQSIVPFENSLVVLSDE
jgi:bacillithiol biosynthesis cysteine-adding enzyme BshC